MMTKKKLQKLAKAYEAYSNLECYTKERTGGGLLYCICMLRYEEDHRWWRRWLPISVVCMYQPKDESGNRYIRYNNVEEDQTLQAYVQELEQDPEVKALYDDVNARYQEALNSDPTLAEFVQNATGKANENTGNC